MALNEELPLQFFDGDAPFCMKVWAATLPQEVLVGLWGHTQSFG
jgi:hypothetical protein